MNRFPDFGKEVKRPFEVHENCYDCAEFYHGCEAWPAARTWGCADYLQLPDVGLNGTTGQVIPPSRMRGRTKPRLRHNIQVRNTTTTPHPPVVINMTRIPSPAGYKTLDGKRHCSCGAEIRNRECCCQACRTERRKKTLQSRHKKTQPSSDVSLLASGTPSE